MSENFPMLKYSMKKTNLIMLIITTKFAKEVDTWNYKVSKYVAHLPRLKSFETKVLIQN